jgi:hypothetical protein
LTSASPAASVRRDHSGIRDRETLETLSAFAGDWDRPVETITAGSGESRSYERGSWLADKPTRKR